MEKRPGYEELVKRVAELEKEVASLKGVGEDRFRFALEASEIGAWDLDLIDQTAWRSLRHDQIFGYETLLPEWTYEIFLEHVLPEDRQRVDERFQEALAIYGDWGGECRIRRVDGAVRWIWAKGRSLFDETGRPRRMLGLVQDMTERKRAEAAIRENEMRLRMSLDISRTVAFDQDRDLVYTDVCNPAPGFLDRKSILLAIDPKVKAIVSSGYSTDPVMAEHREHGFSRVLEKPYERRQLIEAVSGVLGQP